MSSPDIQDLVVVFVVNGFTPQTLYIGIAMRIIDSQEIVSDSPQHEFRVGFLEDSQNGTKTEQPY